MNLVQWLQARHTRKRLDKLGQPPVSADEYARTKKFLRLLQRHSDPTIDPDEIRNFRFRLAAGEWAVTGSRRELETRFSATIIAQDEHSARVAAFWADRHRRQCLRQYRAEIRRAQWRRAAEITGSVLLFSAQAIGVVLIVTVALFFMAIPDVAIGLIGATALLDRAVRDIERF